MHFFWASVVKDLRRYRRDPITLALWFALPFVIAGMIGLVFGRGNGRPQGLLLIADEDGGLAGAFLRESISRGPLGTMLAIQRVERAEGRRRIDQGEGSALLIIPQGYDRAVIRDEAAQLTLITNPEERFMPQVIQETTSAMMNAAYYLQQIAGSQLRKFEDTPLSRRSLTDLAGGVIRSTRAVNTYLQPPRIVVKPVPIGDPSAHRPSIAEILFPGIVFLVILMMSAGMSVEIWRERAAGSVRRLAGSAASLNGFLAGKAAVASLVLFIAIALTFGFARLIFQIPMRAAGLAIAWSGFAALVLYCGLLVAQLLLAGEHTATTVCGMIMVPLAMLGGSFFPIEAMPDSFARFAAITPNGWMLLRLHAILTAPVAAAELARTFGILTLAAALLFALARRQLIRRLAA
jgi:ABC-type multidrug transport system permease subunit